MENKIYKIAISSGHYANTGGKRTPPIPHSLDIDGDNIPDIQAGEQYREHYANTGVAYYLDIAYRRCGFDTLKVGWNDKNGADDFQDISLSYRQVLTAAGNCDLSVAIHFNAIGKGDAFNDTEGICTFIHSDLKKAKDSKSFATSIHKYLIQGTKQRNLNLRTAEFSECDAKAMNVKACALCELAFMTNLREATELMSKESFWIECAEEICRGTCEYLGVKYIEPIKEVINNEDEEEMTQEQFNKLYLGMLKDLSDDPESDWSDKEGWWDKATEKKIVNGLSPTAPITREQIIAVMGRLGMIK